MVHKPEAVDHVVEKALEGADPKTPFYLQLGVIGIVGLAVIVFLAIAMPLYFAYGGK